MLRLLPSEPSLPTLAAAVVLTVHGMGCARGGEPQLALIEPAEVRVGETLRLPLVVEDGGGRIYRYDFRAPTVDNVAATAEATSVGADRGEFRFSPLGAQVGRHRFTFRLLTRDGSLVHARPAIIEVLPGSEAAPVFLRPSAGAAYDLSRDPCVNFDVVVRDLDSPAVAIRARQPLPDGARIHREDEESKTARFAWCPSASQVSTFERWTIRLEADDFRHPPVPHDHMVVLRSEPKPDCPGQPPRIRVLAPMQDDRVTGRPGYEVVVEVEDDGVLREPPLLFFTDEAPADETDPDVTQFRQIEFEESGSVYRARIPPLDIEQGTEQPIYMVVSATDNDDFDGTECDHRVDTELRRFIATADGEKAAVCDPCRTSADCRSGLCAAAAEGPRCLDSCSSGGGCVSGACEDVVTVEGSVLSGCGDVTRACGSPPRDCTNDDAEPNDAVGDATRLYESSVRGRICAGDQDVYAIDAPAETEVEVTLDGFVHDDGDLDLHLLDSDGTVIDQSASVGDMEQVVACRPAATTLYARVFGFREAENPYRLRVSRRANACQRCEDDDAEEDDSLGTGRAVDFDRTVPGTICPGDVDFFRFTVDEPVRVRSVLLLGVDAGDLDLDLVDASGRLVDTSRGTDEAEEIAHDLDAAGTYGLRVFGFDGAAGEYEIRTEVTPL